MPNIPKSESPRNNKVQLKHVLLDVDFFDKPKIVAMMARHGHLSALYLVQIMATLSKATNAEMDVYAAYGLASKFSIPTDSAKTIVEYCVKEGMLDLENEVLTNSRVSADQEKCAEAREKSITKQQKYRDKQLENGNVTGNETSSVTVSPVTDTVTVYELDIKNNGEPEIFDPDPEWDRKLKIQLPQILNNKEPWLVSNAFMVAGRRPMIKYPDIWISPAELKRTIELWESSELPPKYWRDICLKATTRAKDQQIGNKLPDRVNCASWMQGDLYRAAVIDYKTDLQLQQTKERAYGSK